MIPNDRGYPEQWALPRIRAPEGWSITTGKDVVIAVLDTGVDYNHPDLTGRFVDDSLWRNFTDEGSSSAVMDGHGHGTHVTGIAAATTNNTRGVAGVNWGARVMPVKVLRSDGVGRMTWVSDAIRYAADNGARVINLSLASTSSDYSSSMQSQIDYARSKGAVVVVAAGNCAQGSSNPACGNQDNPVMYPAALRGTLAVAATTVLDGHAPYSSYGDYVDVAAPGGTGSQRSTAIYSTFPGNSYAVQAGTSMATPHVAGLAALIVGERRSLAPADVEEIIMSTAADLGDSGDDPYFGHGRIDMKRALETAGYWSSTATTQSMQMDSRTEAHEPARARPATDCSARHVSDQIVVRASVDQALLREAGLKPAAVQESGELVGWKILTIEGSACEAVQALNRAAGELVAELDLIVTLPAPAAGQ